MRSRVVLLLCLALLTTSCRVGRRAATAPCALPVLHTLRDGLDDRRLRELDGRVVIVEGLSYPADSWPLGVADEYHTLWLGRRPLLSGERSWVELRQPFPHGAMRRADEVVRMRGVLETYPPSPEAGDPTFTDRILPELIAKASLRDAVLLPR